MTNIEVTPPDTPRSRSRYYASTRAPRPVDESKKLSLNSKLSHSGRRVFAIGGDGRSIWTVRWRTICERHFNDLGGALNLSEAQLSMIRRASAMTVQLESMEARMSTGDVTVPLNIYCMVASEMRRLFETIGTVRLARDISGEVEEYFEPRRPTTDRMRKAHRP